LLCVFARNKKALQQTRQALLMARGSMLISPALGIGAASFWSEAEKDIAESPTAERSGAGTPKERRLQVNKTT
jgi:hypothetical protein